MEMNASVSRDATDGKPAAGIFATRVGRAVRNGLLAVVGTVFLLWLVLFITKGRFLKHPFESIATRMAGRDVKV